MPFLIYVVCIGRNLYEAQSEEEQSEEENINSAESKSCCIYCKVVLLLLRSEVMHEKILSLTVLNVKQCLC